MERRGSDVKAMPEDLEVDYVVKMVTYLDERLRWVVIGGENVADCAWMLGKLVGNSCL